MPTDTPQQKQNKALRQRGGDIVTARLEPEIMLPLQAYINETGLTRQGAIQAILKKFFESRKKRLA